MPFCPVTWPLTIACIPSARVICCANWSSSLNNIGRPGRAICTTCSWTCISPSSNEKHAMRRYPKGSIDAGSLVFDASEVIPEPAGALPFLALTVFAMALRRNRQARSWMNAHSSEHSFTVSGEAITIKTSQTPIAAPPAHRRTDAPAHRLPISHLRSPIPGHSPSSSWSRVAAVSQSAVSRSRSTMTPVISRLRATARLESA